MICHVGGEFGEDAGDLPLLGKLQLPQFIIQINDNLRLDKQRRPGLRLIVNNTGESPPVLLLYRNYISAVTHGDDGILQVRPVIL